MVLLLEEANAIKAGLHAGNADIVTRALVFANQVEPQVLKWLDNVRVKRCKILAVILHDSRHEKWLPRRSQGTDYRSNGRPYNA